MSTVVNERVKIRCNTVITQVFTLLILCIELIAAIPKSKGSIEVCPSLSKLYIVVNSDSPVIYSSLVISLFFSSKLQSHL